MGISSAGAHEHENGNARVTLFEVSYSAFTPSGTPYLGVGVDVVEILFERSLWISRRN